MKKDKKTGGGAATAQLRYGNRHPFGVLDSFVPLGDGEATLYQCMKEALPVLDAAVQKLVRLIGGFTVAHKNAAACEELNRFLKNVPCGRAQYGMDNFLAAYLDSLLTYGRAVGEMVLSGGHLAAVVWGDVTKLHIRQGDSPLDVQLCMAKNGHIEALPWQDLLLFTTLNPEAAHPYGTSMMRSMPFLADVLLKIYHTMGVNWERAGNVRYSVVYKPDGEVDAASAHKRAEEMAAAWRGAMQDAKSGAVRDFVAVGDVQIKVIGADGKVLDSEVPVRQILEQLVAKTSLPPFMLGFSWASTERMSSQQADLLTSELWAVRRTVEPVLRRICQTWLRLEGYGGEAEIVWDEISLQDTLEESHAQLYRAQAAQLMKEEN